MAILAQKCPNITVVVLDMWQARIDAWNSDELPIYEPGLDDVVKAVRGKNLSFSTEVEKHVADADIIFVVRRGEAGEVWGARVMGCCLGNPGR